jgi:hypothetical protein
MSNRFAYVRKLGTVWPQGFVVGCATTGATKQLPSVGAAAKLDPSNGQHRVVEMPTEAAEARTNVSAPIWSVMTSGEVVYAYVFGYPFYPEGEAARCSSELRKAGAEGAKHSRSVDNDGVAQVVEELPAISCRFDGVREHKRTFMPVSLSCARPAPTALGGGKRPVLGAIAAGATAEEVLQQPTMVENFFGAFPLTCDDFAAGLGTAFFNTTQGQIRFAFKEQKLDQFVYDFDPGVSGWRDPKSWECVL